MLLWSSSDSLGMASATDPLAAAGHSPLRGALLALLVQGPSHGYELANRLERQLGPGWPISRPSLYRMLKGLRADGLLTATEPEAAESKIVYSATELAEPALYVWMESPLTLGVGQLQLQARMIVARREDLPRLLIAVNSYERTLFARAAEIKSGMADASSLRGAMMKMVREAQRHRISAELLWLDESRRTVHALMALGA
jgi:DNA-binding PadR family transcriptional regulator